MEPIIVTEPTGVMKIKDFAKLKEMVNAADGETQLTGVLSGLKAFNNDQYSSVLNNYKESLKPSLREEFKNELYKEHKRDIHGSLEKEIMKKYGLTDLKPGVDFKTTEELFVLVEAKIKKDAGNPDDPNKTKQFTDKIEELNKSIEGMVKKEEFTKLQTEYFDSILDLNISQFGPRVDVDEDKVAGQLNFLKYNFTTEGYKLSKKDNTFVVIDKEGKEVLDQTSFKPVPVSTFLEGFAAKHLTLKNGPASGRGANEKPDTSQNAELVQLKTKDQLIDYLKKKNIAIGSTAFSGIYGEWRKIHNIKD